MMQSHLLAAFTAARRAVADLAFVGFPAIILTFK
jgi:hypothetical protein